MQVGRYIGMLRDGERELAEALTLMSHRHERDAEVADACVLLARWSRSHVDALEPLAERYGERRSDRAERLRTALFYGTRVGGFGQLQDLSDLAVLVNSVKLGWTALAQAANELRDEPMQRVCLMAAIETKRQLAWIQTQIKHKAPEALTSRGPAISETAASLPKPANVAAVPDPVWAPLAGGALALVVGIVALIAGKPILLPSLGPTAYLQAETPAHPTARVYNTIVGHIIGLGAGFFGVFLIGARNEPALLTTRHIVSGRVWAAVIAIAVTILVALLLRASHPPAAATTLLVALGSIRTWDDSWHLIAGAVLIALVGEVLRVIRTDTLPALMASRTDSGGGVRAPEFELANELGLPVRFGRHAQRPL